MTTPYISPRDLARQQAGLPPVNQFPDGIPSPRDLARQQMDLLDPFEEDEAGEDEPLWKYLTNLAKYSSKAVFDNPLFKEYGAKAPFVMAKQFGQAIVQLDEATKKNIRSEGTPIKQITKQVAANLKEMFTPKEGSNIIASTGSMLVKGLFETTVEPAVELLTGTKRIGDTPIIPTVTEKAQAIKDLSAAVAMGVGYEGTARLLSSKLAPTGIAAMAEQGTIKNLGKAALTAGTASAAAGAAGGAVMGLGEDDLAVSVISGALAGIPLGLSLGLVPIPFVWKGELGRVKEANLRAFAQESAKQSKLLHNDLIQEYSSQHGLASTENSTLEQLISNIDAVANSDASVSAIVRSSVSNKEAWIVPNVTNETLSRVTSGISNNIDPSPPKEWLEAPGALKISRPTFKGLKIDWKSNFDKAAYILSNPNSKAKNFSLFKDAVIDEFSISFDDIVAHGKYVRESIRNMIAGGKVERLTQHEFDTIDRALITRGTKLVGSLPDGGTLKVNNVIWSRVGNTMTDGNLVYPVNDNNLLRTIGRKDLIDPLSGKITLPALPYRPDFARATGDFHFYKYGTGTQYDLLISPIKLDKPHAAFYESTGFLPGEVVSLDGRADARILQGGNKPNTFMVSTVRGSKKTRIVAASRLQHHPDGIKSAVKGLKAFYATSENLFEKFFQDFHKEFKNNLIRKEGQQSFDNIFERARIKYGIPEDQRAGLKLSTYRRLQDDFIDQLDPDERDPLLLMRMQMERLEEQAMFSKSTQIHNLALGNGLYIKDKGAGNFEIRQITDNKILGSFGGFDAALEFLQKSYKRPQNSLDMDGGTPVPPNIGDIGGYDQPWKGPISNAWSSKIDRFRIGRGHVITPSQETLHAFGGVLDNALDTGTYFKTRIGNWFKTTQDATKELRRMKEYDARPLVAKYLQLEEALGNIPKDRLEVILGYVEAASPEEIASGKGSFPANSLEDKTARQWAERLNNAGASVLDIEELYYAGEKLGGKAGTPDFEAAVQNMVKNGVDRGGKKVKANPEVASIVVDLARMQTSDLVGQLPFRKFLTLKLTDAYANPAQALSRNQYFTARGMSLKEQELALRYEQFLDDVFAFGEFPESEKVNFHVPSIRSLRELNSFAESALPNDFLLGMSKATIGDDLSMVRDPSLLAYKYLDEVIRYKTEVRLPDGEVLNYNKWMNRARTELDEITNEALQIEKKLGAPGALSKSLQETGLRHLGEVQGRGDQATWTRNGLKSLYKHLGWDEKASGEMATSLIAMSTQGANQAMWVRDFVSAAGNAYILFGSEFALKAIGKPVKNTVIESLERQGKITIVAASEMAAPTSIRLSKDLGGVITKQADLALTLSGQHHIYRHRMAGIYLATEDLVNKWLPKLHKREITKDFFMDKMNIDVHDPAVGVLFNQFISSGDTQAAITYLATQNSKRIMNLFGYANTPIGWTTNIGKLLGQFGSWSANHTATIFNGTRNLNSAAGAKRILRAASYETALRLTGYATGMNFASQFGLANPLVMIPGVGPIADLQDDIRRWGQEIQSGELNDVSAAVRKLPSLIPGLKMNSDFEFEWNTEVGRLYAPYSTATENLLKGLLNDPGYSPFQQMLQSIGLKPMEPE